MVKWKFFLLVVSLSFIDSLIGQEVSDISFFKERFLTQQEVNKQKKYTEVTEDRNAIQHSGVFLFSVYKNLISSQDGSTCAFYPTCSSYCSQAIRRHGLISGGIMTMDRLTRCNSLSPEKYSIDMKKKKLIDNVE